MLPTNNLSAPSITPVSSDPQSDPSVQKTTSYKTFRILIEVPRSKLSDIDEAYIQKGLIPSHKIWNVQMPADTPESERVAYAQSKIKALSADSTPHQNRENNQPLKKRARTDP